LKTKEKKAFKNVLSRMAQEIFMMISATAAVTNQLLAIIKRTHQSQQMI
jgi:hypothetical protein